VTPEEPPVERQRIDVDVACVGFGPATAGFLTTLSRKLVDANGAPSVESVSMPGMPLQIVCYERADDIGFGVSGVVTKARALRMTFPDLNAAQVPMSVPVQEEKIIYLLDPIGASRRSWHVKAADACIRVFNALLPYQDYALELPWAPEFLHKTGGMILSMGQFMQWVGTQVQSSGLVQIWPGMPVSEAILEGDRVVGLRLLDQGVDKSGKPAEGFSPGMDVRAALTVIGDGPVGPVAEQLDQHFGRPEGHHARDWAVGMKFVIDLPPDTALRPGTVFHTFGFPEPEIFGFMYVHPENVASLGIFVPSWFDSPVRTSFRYLQHWMLHPYVWRYVEGGKLRSWGAKTLGESGLRGEPWLVGDGYARIGEGSGSTNVLTGSGVDEAWMTGVLLAESVYELLEKKRPFTRENLEETYVTKRRKSWLEDEARIAQNSRDGFQRGFVRGMIGMALAGLTKGRLSFAREPAPPWQMIPTLEQYYRGRISPKEIQQLRKECQIKGTSLHSALMQRCGWPSVPYDGQLLVSHQDALLLGGKVQAPPGYADHVVFLYPELCEKCGTKICVELCSGQAITPGQRGVPLFDREKCIHCGVCHWNCVQPVTGKRDKTNIAFRAGTGGLHSAEN
jgi:electron-transferring-flavoprotein dehydrogenase